MFYLNDFLENSGISKILDSFHSVYLLIHKQLTFYFLFLSSLFFLFILLTSCNDNFQPFQEKEQATFSIFGYLDSSADTQWVRVTPVRELRDTLAEKPEMTVTLEHLQSGNKSVMEDSLFIFQRPTGMNAINVWTTMALEPGEAYRLHAERPNGANSYVMINLPESFPTPRLEILENATFDRLHITGIDRLVDIQLRSFFHIYYGGVRENRMVSRALRNSAEKTAPGEYVVPIRGGGIGLALPRGAEVHFLHTQIFVANGGPEWNEEILSLDDLVYTLPDAYSNIVGGVGYVVGITSKSIPYKSCFSDQGENIACAAEKPFW